MVEVPTSISLTLCALLLAVLPAPAEQRNAIARPTPGGDHIFFIEGSCSHNTTSDQTVLLDTTQACAVESAARANPDMTIFLFHTCPLDENSVMKSSRMVQEIFNNLENVFVWHQSLESLFKNSALEDLLRSNKMLDTTFKSVLLSDVVRLLLLKMYGGAYLDLDVISRRPLSLLADNFAGLQSSAVANSAALRFSMDAVGRKMADMSVQEVAQHFNGEIWGANGPLLITRVLKRLCKFNELRATTGRECEGFVIYDEPVFYAVPYNSWKDFYDEKRADEVLHQVENSIGVHLWNSMARNDKKKMDQFRDSKQPKMVLQRKYCPTAHSYVKPKPPM